MPIEQPKDESTYFIDAEDATEMARLTKQDRLITESMGGLFPQEIDLSNVHDILDIACGPGGWVIDVAYAHPNKQVTGIDISKRMIEYARAQARVQWLDNATFKTMDALKPLDFAENSFDFVNARFISGFMLPAAWPAFMRECLRILRPGGILRLTELELPITTSFASEKLFGMIASAMQKAGQSFSPDGRHAGITPVLGRFFNEAGIQNIQKMAFALDYSSGTEAHESQCQNTKVFLKLLEPFVVKMGITTEEEFDRLHQQATTEMYSDDFCALWFYLSIWGEKPK